MEVTQIKKVDLKKLLKNKGITLYRLSKQSGVNYSYLSRAKDGYCRLSAEAWDKIKFFI